MIAGAGRLRASAVDQEHATTRAQRPADLVPEGDEPALGHVREPEREEADVERRLRRCPLEQVGLDVPNQLGADALAVDSEHLGCRVDRGQPARAGDQPPCPEPGSAGQLEHLAAGANPSNSRSSVAISSNHRRFASRPWS